MANDSPLGHLGHGIAFGAVGLAVVEPGTTVCDDATGQCATVTETTVVFQGTKAFMTKATFEQVKAAAAAPPKG